MTDESTHRQCQQDAGGDTSADHQPPSATTSRRAQVGPPGAPPEHRSWPARLILTLLLATVCLTQAGCGNLIVTGLLVWLTIERWDDIKEEPPVEWMSSEFPEGQSEESALRGPGVPRVDG